MSAMCYVDRHDMAVCERVATAFIPILPFHVADIDFILHINELSR